MMSILSDKSKDIFNAVEYFVNNNISIKECAKLFNIHRQTLSIKLTELDLNEDRRKYKINENFFEVIDSEEKAYWLGFIVADGCLKNNINQLSITLSIKDIFHLNKFRQAIESKHPITTEKRTIMNNKEYEVCCLHIQNKNIYNDLLNLNINPNKTFHELPTNISLELIPHYIRGIFDGDGWISWGNGWCDLGFGMGFNILEYIKKQFETQADIKYYKIKPFKSIYRYRIQSKIQILKALNYMYNNSTVYLDRKHERYLDFCRLNSKATEELRGLERN